MALRRACILVVLMLSAAALGATEPVHGGGATFPYPLYAKWAYLYKAKTGLELNYLSIGSGGGIEQIKSRTVDFGATEVPLSAKEIEEAGLVQLPMVIGGVAIAVNRDGVKDSGLKLTGEVLARIYLGRITSWRDEAIKALNPGLTLPDLPITVVHRADGSGTTWLFTNYLSLQSAEWAKAVGTGASVRWPAGAGGKGSEGVAGYVKTIPGAIGYVEATYAVQSHLATASLKNREGLFVAPTPTAFKAAAAQADWTKPFEYGPFLLDLPGRDTWPIVGASYVLFYREDKKAERLETLLSFFRWCLTGGASVAEDLGYVPLPEAAVRRVEAAWPAPSPAGKSPRAASSRP